MIEKVDYYTAVCDNCKSTLGDFSDYSAWNDKSVAKEEALECGFIEHKGKLYCSNCWEYDENEELIVREKVKNSRFRIFLSKINSFHWPLKK